MTKNKECPHRMAVNSTICKYCGRPICDLCLKEHLEYHIENDDKEIPWDEMYS